VQWLQFASDSRGGPGEGRHTSSTPRARFALSSEDAELLLLLADHPTVQGVATSLRRDPSVVSRRLQALAARLPVLEKRGTRWRLTRLGKRVNDWSREAIHHQRSLLGQEPELRLGATRAFATHALAPRLPVFLELPGAPRVRVRCFEPGGLDRALLEGQVELAFSCGRPGVPEVRTRGAVPERYVGVMARALAPGARPDPWDLPHLAFGDGRGGYPFLDQVERCREIAATLDDALALREAVRAGVGWAILPRYLLREDLAAGSLVEFALEGLPEPRYGVWWQASRPGLEPWVDAALAWLEGLEL